jgi:hypothetical protein
MTTEPKPEIKGVVLTKLAELPEKAFLDEAALSAVLGVCKRTVRRMVRRFELPPPVRFAGRATWQAGKILTHFEERAEAAAREAEALQAKVGRLT